MKIIDFREGDHVTLKIPANVHHSSDHSRLPCVIVHKISGNQPIYRLLCKYGTINNRYTAASLKPNPSAVKCETPEVYVSLRETLTKLQLFSDV